MSDFRGINSSIHSGNGGQNAIDLSSWAGIPVTLDTAAVALLFGDSVPFSAPPEQRHASDLRGVLHQPDAARDDDRIYTAYRDIVTPETEAEIGRRRLAYVALVLRPGTVGAEWVRTRGHTNPHARSTATPLPEVHEVWHGQGLLYLQKNASAEAGNVIVIPLFPGQKAVVAPGWASLVANIGSEPLVIGSWRARDSVPQHDALVALGGMAHFVLQDTEGAQDCRFAPNPAYADPPAPRWISPQNQSELGLIESEPMFRSFHRNPDFFRFMLRPQDYDRIWAGLYRGDAA